jgi:hypothetical protein
MPTAKKQRKKPSEVHIPEEVREYRASDKHRVGQKIYHPVFEDVGEIVKREKSPSGNMKKITVKFERVGKKILLTEYPPS